MKTPLLACVLVGAALAYAAHPLKAGGQEAAELASASKASLQSLMATVPAAKALANEAEAILVFPKITKAGLGIGGQYGEGALLKKGSAVGYYKTTGASFGLQVGGQQYGYAMFFMNAKALTAARQRQRLRNRCRPVRSRHGRGDGEEHHHHDTQG